MNLSMLEKGKSAKITRVGGSEKTVKRLYVMGVSKGVNVVLMRYAPLNCPLEIKVRDFYLALRVEDAKKIEVEYE